MTKRDKFETAILLAVLVALLTSVAPTIAGVYFRLTNLDESAFVTPDASLKGALVYGTDAGAVYYSDGTSWKSLTGGPTAVADPGTLTGTGLKQDTATGTLWYSLPDGGGYAAVGGFPNPGMEQQLYAIMAAYTSDTSTEVPVLYTVGPRRDSSTLSVTSVTGSVATQVANTRNQVKTSTNQAFCSESMSAGFTTSALLPRFCARVITGSDISLQRAWTGLATSNSLGTSDPDGGYMMVRYDTGASDTAWMACTSTGTSSACASTGVTVATSTPYQFCIDCRAAGSCVFTVNGVPKATVSSNLPPSWLELRPVFFFAGTTNATRSIAWNAMTVETW